MGKAAVPHPETLFANGKAARNLPTIAAMSQRQNVRAGQAFNVMEAGRAGTFVFEEGDQSAAVAADPYKAVTVPLSSDLSGESGAYKRQHAGAVWAQWAEIDVTGVADVAAVLASLAGLSDAGLVLGPGVYRIAGNATINVPVTFLPGAIIKPDDGVWFVCESAIAAAAGQQIFDRSAGGQAGARSIRYPARKAYGENLEKPECPFTWTGSLPLPSILYVGADGRAVYESYDLGNFAPATDAEVYVSWTGDNGTGDGSIGAPYKTIVYAQQQVEADGGITAATFYVDAAVPQYRSNPMQGGSFSKNCVVKPYNGEAALFISSDDHSAQWAAHSGNAYVVTRSDAKVVVDRTNVDENGDWVELDLVADAAAVVATPGSWYTDGADVYVHAHDSRDLTGDADVFVLIQSGAGSVQVGATAYLESCAIYGFNLAMGGGSGSVFINKNCEFKYQVVDDGVNSSGGEVYSQNALLVAAQKDGFSYGQGGGGTLCKALEIDCEVRGCGIRETANTHNATTAHAASEVVRVNGNYSASMGPVVADVGGGYSWCIGCDSSDSRAYAAGSLKWRQRSNYYCQAGVMWIEGGSSKTVTETAAPVASNPGDVVGSVYDLTSDGALVFVRGLRHSGRIDSENVTGELLEF